MNQTSHKRSPKGYLVKVVLGTTLAVGGMGAIPAYATTNTTTTSQTTTSTAPAYSTVTLTGTVYDASNKPVPYADVTLTVNGSLYQTVADANGVYTKPNLPANTYTLTAYDGNYHMGTATVTVGDAQTATKDITLTSDQSAGEVTGTVTGTSGTVMVQVSTSTATLNMAAVGSDGTYHVSAPAGTYTLTLMTTSGTVLMQVPSVLVTAGQTITKDMAVSSSTPSGVTQVTGTVTDSSGNPVPNANVFIINSDGNNYGAMTNANGVYTCQLNQAGTYHVEAFGTDSSGKSMIGVATGITVTSGLTSQGDVTLSQQQGSVNGSVSQAVTGKPVQGMVNILASDGSDFINDYSSDGTFSMPLPPGDYTAQVKVGSTTTSQPFTVTGGQPTNNVGLVIDGNIIYGTVTDPSGMGVGNVMVNATDASTGQSAGTQTDANGAYQLVVPDGSYQLSVSSGNLIGSAHESVSSDAYQQANIQMAQGGTASISLTNGSNNTPMNGYVSFNDGHGNTYGVQVTNGTATLTLPAATYTARTYLGGQDYSQTVQITAGQTSNVDFHSDAAGVSGKILDVNGNAANGAQVSLVSTDGHGDYGSRTNPDGSYSFFVQPGTYLLEAWQGSSYISGGTITVTTGSLLTGQDLQLQPAGVISGSVLDATTGQPVSGAQVEIDDPSGNLLNRIWPDNNGNYSMAVPPKASAYTVKVILNGSTAAYAQAVVQLGQTTPANLSVTTTEVYGLVTDASGKPVANATVFLSDPMHGSPYMATTDSTGHYQALVSANTYSVLAESDATQTAGVSTVTVDSGQHIEKDIQLGAGGTVSGTITDSSSNPLPTTVTFTDANNNLVLKEWPNQDGTYSVVLPVGTYTAQVNEDGTSQSLPINVTAGGNTDGSFTIGITTISGTVVDANGNPVPHLPIEIMSSTGGYMMDSTDSNGQFTDHPGPGTYTVRAQQGVMVGQQVVQVDAGQSKSVTVPLKLAIGSVISGIVTDASSQPAGGVQIKAWDKNGNLITMSTTNGQGQYELDFPSSGTYTVRVDDASQVATVPNITTSAGQTVTQNIQLADAGTISGTVKDTNGNPISPAWVKVLDANGNIVAEGGTDSTGTYSLSVAPGQYQVVAQIGSASGSSSGGTVSESQSFGSGLQAMFQVSHTGVQVTSGNTNPQNFTLETSGVSGTVIGPNGAPASNAEIQLSGPDGVWGTNTDDSGNYHLYAPAGTYQLQAYQNYGFSSQTVTFTDGQMLTNTTVNLAPAGRVSGTLADQNGNPVGNSWFDFYDTSGNLIYQGFTTDGSFGAPLPPGTYSLKVGTVNAPPQQVADNISVVANQTTPLQATVQVTLNSVHGTVTNGSLPLPNATVTLMDSSGKVLKTTTTDGDGTYQFGNLSDGGYMLHVDASGYEAQTVSLSLSDEASAEKDVQLTSTANYSQVKSAMLADIAAVQTKLQANGGLDAVKQAAAQLQSSSLSWNTLVDGAVASANGTSSTTPPTAAAIAAVKDLFSFAYVAPTEDSTAAANTLHQLHLDFAALNPAITDTDVSQLYSNLKADIALQLVKQGTTTSQPMDLVTAALVDAMQNTVDAKGNAVFAQALTNNGVPLGSLQAIDNQVVSTVDPDGSATDALIAALLSNKLGMATNNPATVDVSGSPVSYNLAYTSLGIQIPAGWLTWTSSNPSTADFEPGTDTLIPYTAGQTVVTASYGGYAIAQMAVTVSAAAEQSVKVDSITVNGSPAPANLTANVTLNNGDLSVQLQNKDGNYDLSSLGINPGDDVTVKVEAPSDFTPITETAAGLISGEWSITPPSQSGGTEVITLEGSPVATSWTQTPPPANITDGTWPPQNADVDYKSMLMFDLSNLSQFASQLGNHFTQVTQVLKGSYVGTNAQLFTQPIFDPQTDAFDFTVAAPHFKTDGTVQTGVFKAFLPASALSQYWKFSNPSGIEQGQIEATLKENGGNAKTVEPSIEHVPGGIIISYAGFNYSVESISLTPNTTLPAPTGLANSNLSSSGWTTTWGSVDGAGTYNVYLNGTKVGSTSSTSYTFTKEQPDTNYTVTVTAVAGDGTESAQSAGSTLTTLLTAPTVGPVKTTDTTVTGKAAPGSKVTVYAQGSSSLTSIGQATAGPDGTYSVTIPAQAPGTELVVKQTNANGTTSDSAKVEVWADECFIATAAFGSKMQPSVATLRQFRDKVLLVHPAGQRFVRWYYRVSPPIANSIRSSGVKRALVRMALKPAVLVSSVWVRRKM